MSHAPGESCCGCHTPVPTGAKYCAQCGTPVPRSRGPSSPPTALAPTAESTPATMIRLEPPAGATPAPSTVVDGKYLVLERLGGGGFGEVFRVRDTLLGREFAMKTLHTHLSAHPDVRERFIREARVLMDLQHPNLVPTRHLGEWRGIIYLIMDLSPGRPLSDVIRERRRVPGRTAAAVAIEVLKALEYAHGMGVLHRDLKPSNLLVRPNDSGRWEVRLLDFGVAKVLADSKLGEGDWRTLATGGPVGTWHYMSPEQIGYASPDRGDAPIDARSDVYSVGVVLYEMITGLLPFRSDQVLKLIREVQQEPPAPFRAHGVEEDPPGLEALVLRTLAKDPADRPQSAAALLAELQNLVAGPPTVIPARDRGPTPAPATSPPVSNLPSAGGAPGSPAEERAPAAAATVRGDSASTHAAPTPAPPALPVRRRGGRPGRVAWVAGLLALAALGSVFLLPARGARMRAIVIAASPTFAGSTASVPDAARLPAGTTLELRATPAPGYAFARWSDGSTENPRRIRLDADLSLAAEFRSLRHPLLLRVVPAGSGRIGPLAERSEHAEGDEVEVTAEPAPGWRLVAWSDGVANATRTFRMPGREAELTATFDRAVGARTLPTDPDGAGEASLVPMAGVDEPGVEARLFARPQEGWRFVAWSDGNTDNPRALAIPAAGEEPIARFERIHHPLLVRSEPEEGGSIARVPEPGEAGYPQGGAVALAAAPAPDWRFLRWSDGVEAGTREVTMAAPLDLTAHFAPILAASALPEDGGKVAIQPSGYDAGDEVTLLAAAREGWRFTGWMDGERSAARTVRADAPAVFVARFEPAASSWSIVADPPEGGSVEFADPHPVVGRSVTLFARAADAEGWRFTGWSDDVAGAQRVIRIEEGLRLTARFRRYHSLAWTSLPAEGGSVLPTPGEFEHGTQVELRAQARAGWCFTGWSDGPAAAVRVWLVEGPARFEAHFAPEPARNLDPPAIAVPGDSPAPPGLKRLGRIDGHEQFLHEQSGIAFVSVPGEPPLWLGRTEVTNAQFRRFRPSHRSGEYLGHSLDEDDQPVVNVSWTDAQEFCRTMGLRLPTEAEWLRAARGGGASWPPGPDAGNYADAAFADISARRPNDELYQRKDGHAVTAPVGGFPPPGGPGDAAGVRDLIGNVWEWCADSYGDQYRVVRGGCWMDSPGELERLEYRNSHPPQWDSGARDPRQRGGREDSRALPLRIGIRVAYDPRGR